MPNDVLVLVGLNGAGKSSVLQAFSFARMFAAGTPDRFFEDRHWNSKDVRSQVGRKSPFIRFDLLLEGDGGQKYLWQFNWGINSGLNAREVVWRLDQDAFVPTRLLDFNRSSLTSDDERLSLRGVSPSGSILSLVDRRPVDSSRNELVDLSLWASRISSLELLSPSAMRRQARGAHTDIGERGERLASFIASLSTDAKARLADRLSEFYPITRIDTVKKRAGWVDMKIAETFRDVGPINTNHASDGFLRLLALCAIPEFSANSSVVLLDEIEDGIEPHILQRLVERLSVDSKCQLFITSHSPIVVSFMQKNEVVLMGRTPDGRIVCRALSELESIRRGQEYFGDGELWTMMDKDQLNSEIVSSSQTPQNGAEAEDYLKTRFSPRAVFDFMSI